MDTARPLTLDGEHGDLTPFACLDELADRARVAYLVEMDHFIHEKYEFRLLCIRYLASRGWRWFGEELDVCQGERIDHYLRTGDDTLLDPIDEADWYTRGVLTQAVERHPADEMAGEQRRFAHALRRTVPDARWFGFDIGGADADYLELANAATTFAELPSAMALRERIMHERVAQVLRDRPTEKVALMAGSTHLMKDDARVDAPGAVGPGGDTDASIGHHVAHALTDDPVLSIWLLHGHGTSANPWLPASGELAPAPRTVDRDLADAWDEPCLVRVGADHEQRRITQMHNLVMTCRLDEQVDAIVFTPHVTPLRA